MDARAPVLVHGGTGFTGGLVCAALRRRGIVFAVSGRNAARLASLAESVGGVETCVVDLGDPQSIRRAVDGRRVVSACAGPFVLVGEAMLATCARAGIHYIDTTGEQLFVSRSVTRYGATAEASGACVVPAMAYEIAPADWAAHLATDRLGGIPDEIDVLYVLGGASRVASRGTKRSALAQIGAGEAMQYVGGTLVHEAPATVIREFVLKTGDRVSAVSFPSPEAVVVPSHTKSRAVRTFMPMPAGRAQALRAVRGAVPLFARLGERLLGGAIARAKEGPDAWERQATVFEIVVEARRGPDAATVHVRGHDPYGLTGEIQAYAVERLLADPKARGVVAPSMAFDAARSLEALAPFGVSSS